MPSKKNEPVKVSLTETVLISKIGKREKGYVYEYQYSFLENKKWNTQSHYYLINETFKVKAIDLLVSKKQIEAARIILSTGAFARKGK